MGPDAGHGEQQVEEAELLGVAEAVQRLLVLADQVEGMELELATGHGRGQDRGRGEHAIPDPADLDDQRDRP
ncbi:MAG: hypothetical protein WKF78_14755 [Candidatus Limnocylindrales bacterium]